MGNNKKIGSRHKLWNRKGFDRKSPIQSQSKDRPRPTKSSTSKLKLAKGFASYNGKEESFTYDIVDLRVLENALKEVAVCKYCHCSLSLSRKTLSGLATQISLKCNSCDNLKKFNNCEDVCFQETNTVLGLGPSQKFYDLNLRLVYGLRTVGKGLTSALSLCGILNLPAPPSKYHRHELFLGFNVENLCKMSMAHAVEEAVLQNENNRENLCVAVDGSWQKRGHVSLNGILSVTSVDNGKVMDIQVMSKFCQCPNRNSLQHTDSCSANYLGSSGGMEVEGALQIFKRSVPLYNAKYTEYLGDGDTNAYKSVSDAQPYGPDITIDKIECVGHVQKRMGTRLRNLKTKMKKVKLSDDRPLSGKGRLTNLAIQKIQTFYGLAIRRNANKLDSMREDVWATYFHILSSNTNPRHRLCPQDPATTWCKYVKSVAKNEPYDHSKHFHLPEIVMNEIKPTFEALSKTDLLEKCLKGKSQNPNESLNNVIWSRIPKRTFVRLDTLKFGVYEAVLSFNDGYISKINLIEQLGLKIGKNMVLAMLRLDRDRVRKSEKAATEMEKKIRLSRSVAKRKLEDQYEEQEDPDNPSYSAGHY